MQKNNSPQNYTFLRAVASSPRVKLAAAAAVSGMPLRNWYSATFFCIYSVNWTLHMTQTQKPNRSIQTQRERKQTKRRKIQRYRSPGSPLAAMSLWESSTMILSSLDLWTSMLWTADVSAATMAKPFPTNPNTHSIFDPDLSFCFDCDVWRLARVLILRAWATSQVCSPLLSSGLNIRGAGMGIWEVVMGKVVKSYANVFPFLFSFSQESNGLVAYARATGF